MFECGVVFIVDGVLVYGCICFFSDCDVILIVIVFDGGKGYLSLIYWGECFVLCVKYVDVVLCIGFIGLLYWFGGLLWKV